MTLLKRTGLPLDEKGLECASYLVKVYRSTRNPDALPENVIPYEVYTSEDKRKAIECALIIINMLKEAGENLGREEERLIKSVEEFAEELKRRFGKITVILYGSYARGSFNLWNDIDILVISDVFENIKIS